MSHKVGNSKTEWATNGLLGLFFGGMILVALFEDFSVYKLSLPIFVISWIILLVLHELGHALMARLLGWRVGKVCIGSGKLLTKRSILGISTEFRAIPLSGYIQHRVSDLNTPQMKSFLIYAAGPGIELLSVAGIWLIFGSETLLERRPSIGLITIQTFSVAALFGALFNLVPLPHQTDEGMAPSDGLGMIMAWRTPTERYAEWKENEK